MAKKLSEKVRQKNDIFVINVETYCFEGGKGWLHEAQHWAAMQAAALPMYMLNSCEPGNAAVTAGVSVYSIRNTDKYATRMAVQRDGEQVVAKRAKTAP